MGPLVVTQMTLLQIQVCTTLEGDEAIEHETNQVAPAGTTQGWKMSHEARYAPVVCEGYPERKHYILED